MLWDGHSRELIAKEGKIAAGKSYLTNKLYDGEESGDGTDTFSTIVLYFQVLGLGYGVAFVFFVGEVAIGIWGQLRSAGKLFRF